MKFLSDILAKAGLTVDGVVTLNNTATGQTPNANDNSTKLATTAWVRTFVQPYSLPIASDSVLGGIKVGEGLSIDSSTGVLSAAGGASLTSFRSEYIITATAGQTTFTVPNGYTPGKIDLFLNGVYLNDTIYTATDSSTIVLDDPAALDDILTVFVYSTYYVGESPSSRDICTFTATAGQTTFSCSYIIGAVDVYYNGSKLAASEFNASNGTTVVLNTACDVGDFIEVISWVTGGGLSSSRTITIDGVTQDLTANRTWSVLPTGGAAGDILAKVSATNYDVTWIPNFTSTVQHTVKAAVALTKGQAVYVSSADGTNMIVSKASNASEQTSSKTLGLVAQNLAINGVGFVVTEGLLAGLDTSTATAGDPVWLGTDGNLIFGLVNKPYAPAHLVFIGVVTRVQQNNGEIFVKVQNGYELDELHDLAVRNPTDGDMIKYVASTGLWTKIAATTTNITEGTNLYYTDARARGAISVTGSGSYDSSTGVITVTGGVTSVNTLTGDITLTTTNIGEGTNLYYTNARSRAAISLTTSGTSGAATYDNATGVLNIPQYQGGVTSFNTRTGAVTLSSSDVTTALGYTPVTDARTLTINGTTYDLTANRSWTVDLNPSAREIQTFTATASQTTFTVSGGYTVGLIDVFVNGVRLTASDFTATNGTTVVLTTGTGVGNVVDVIKYTSGFTNAVSGTGTTNELAYFTGPTVISSLSTATYPSLTELSYVKGVTSSIQTQLNNKQNTLTNPVTGTGTTNYLPKFTGSTTIGDSAISDTTTEVNITKRVFITSGVNQFVFTPNLSSSSNRIEILGGLPFQINTDGGSIGLNVGGGSSQFSMTNTAASFFIPVTSNGQAATSPAFIANNGVGSSGTAQHYINFTAGTTTIARMLRGNGASGLVANGLNIDNFEGFGVRLNQLGGSGGSFNITGGNVVIGNTVASNVGLTIFGSNAATIYQTSNTGTGAGNGFYVGHTGDISYVWNYNNFPIVLATNNTESIRLFQTTQNVHIGPTPAADNGARLQVSGGDLTVRKNSSLTNTEADLGFYNSFINTNSTNGTGSAITLGSNNNPGVSIYAQLVNNSTNEHVLGFQVRNSLGASTTRMVITGSGNVGIGTPSPSALLDIVGSNSTELGALRLYNSAGSPGTQNSVSILMQNRNSINNLPSVKLIAQESTNDSNLGELVVQTSNDNAATLSEVFRTAQSGAGGARFIRMASGTGGIQFNGDTAAANALDDYEEGTWTPDIIFGSWSFGARSGFYTKIGNLVTANLLIVWSANNSPSGDSFRITLPFTAFGSGNFRAPASIGYTAGVIFNTSRQLVAHVDMGQNYVSFQQLVSGGNPTGLTTAEISSTGEIQISVTYQV